MPLSPLTLDYHIYFLIKECERRDPKGLYKKARAGVIKGFTGIDDVYESPKAPELVIGSSYEPIEDSVAKVIVLHKCICSI